MENTLNFEKEFEARYPDHAFLTRYLREALNKDEVVWSDLTALNLTKIVEYLKQRVCQNTVYNYCCLLKGFLNLVCDEVDLPTHRYAQVLKIRKIPQENVALTEEEVEKLYQYYLTIIDKKGGRNTIAVQDTLTLFVMECYCGARGCDTAELTENNIMDGRLIYVAKKTNNLATMPVHHRIVDLMKHMPKREYANASKNKIIKTICQKVGITKMTTIFYRGKMQTRPKNEFVAMHSARRSFASILAAKGVPIVEIAQYMSHSDINMTQKYIKIDREYSSEGALEFFNGQ